MEIKGKIIHVLPLQEGVSKAGNAWKKQEYVLETYDQYPQHNTNYVRIYSSANPDVYSSFSFCSPSCATIAHNVL